MKRWIGYLALGLVLSACDEEDEIAKQLERPPACLTAEEVLPEGTQSLLVNADTLREFVVGGNRTLLVSAMQVRKAKQAVTISRAELLPSMDLGVLLGSALSPNLLLASVDYMLPFLLPSRWADLKQSKALLKAEKAAFITSELNQVASALAVFYAVDMGFRTRRFLQEEYSDAIVIEALTAEQLELGEVNASDLDLARSQVTSAMARLMKHQRQIDGELAQLRKAMGICSSIPIQVVPGDVKPSFVEALEYEEAMAKVLPRATEVIQLRALQEAAKQGGWSKRFSFIGPVSAGERVSGMVPGEELTFAFSNLVGSASVNFGFAYFPRIEMSARNIHEILARILEAEMEIRKILESNLKAMSTIQMQLSSATETVKLLGRVFTADQKRFREQEISLRDLIGTQVLLRQARLERLQAQFDTNLARLALHRLGRTDQFAKVKGCADGETLASDNPAATDFLDAPCDEAFVRRKLGI